MCNPTNNAKLFKALYIPDVGPNFYEIFKAKPPTGTFIEYFIHKNNSSLWKKEEKKNGEEMSLIRYNKNITRPQSSFTKLIFFLFIYS